MVRWTTRKFEEYVLHAHVRERAIDSYDELIGSIEAIPPIERRAWVGRKLVAIPRIWRFDESRVAFVVYEGDESWPLIYDHAVGSEYLVELDDSEVVVQKTYAVFNSASRRCVVMYNHYGAKARDIAILLQTLARRVPHWAYMDIELVPVISSDFVVAINQLERIRQAAVTLVRPNFDWTDYADDLIESIGERSNAALVEVTASTRRNEDLNRDDGILQFVKRLATAEHPNLKNASIVGRRPGEAVESKIWLRDFVESRKARLPLDEHGQLLEQSVLHTLESEALPDQE